MEDEDVAQAEAVNGRENAAGTAESTSKDTADKGAPDQDGPPAKKGKGAMESLVLLSQQASVANGKVTEREGVSASVIEDEATKKIEASEMRYPPPSPDSAQRTVKLGCKEVGVLAFLELHQSVITSLQPNVRGERDFKSLRNHVKAHNGGPEMLRLLQNLRQEIKKLYGERRKRKQLMAWDQLEREVRIRDNGKRVEHVNKDAVMARAWAVEQLVSKWFMDRTLFDEYFVRELSVHLVGLLARGEKSPGSVLSMPRVVIDKIVYLHLMKCKDRFHELHRMFFSDLFTPADIEIAVLSACNCPDCVRDWDVRKIDHRSLDPHVRFHWTQEKAKQAAYLLRAHLKFGNDVFKELHGKNLPKMRSWNESDFRIVLRCVHTCASCFLCQKGKPVKGRHDRPTKFDLQPGLRKTLHADEADGAPAAAASGSSAGGARSTVGTKNALDFPLPPVSASAAAKFKRLKDTPQTRPLGPNAKREIRQALAEQTSKYAKTTPQGGLSMAMSTAYGYAYEPVAISIEQSLASPDVLRALLASGELGRVGVTVAEGQLDVSGKAIDAAAARWDEAGDMPSIDADQIRKITALIAETDGVQAAIEDVIREAQVEIRRREDLDEFAQPSGDAPGSPDRARQQDDPTPPPPPPPPPAPESAAEGAAQAEGKSKDAGAEAESAENGDH